MIDVTSPSLLLVSLISSRLFIIREVLFKNVLVSVKTNLTSTSLSSVSPAQYAF